MKEKVITAEIEIPEGVTLTYKDGFVTAQGSNGSTKKKMIDPKIYMSVEGNTFKIECTNSSKREKSKIGSFKAHINNLIKGVTEGFKYELKICSGHFPMNVSLSGEKLSVKNFLGEKVPRVLNIKQGAKVKIDGTQILVESNDKEIAGQVAADIEKLCRITNRDRRIFQDGIYIVNKAGKEIV